MHRRQVVKYYRRRYQQDSDVAARAKTANRFKRVDNVRASRDGHPCHEAWTHQWSFPRELRESLTAEGPADRCFQLQSGDAAKMTNATAIGVGVSTGGVSWGCP